MAIEDVILDVFSTGELTSTLEEALAASSSSAWRASSLRSLACRSSTKKWTMPIRHWDLALQQLAIHFEGRINI